MLGRFSVGTEYFYVETELAKARRNYVTTEQFYVATELAKARRNYVAIEQFYAAIELAKVGRISILIKGFYVMTESSATHDKAGRAKAGAHDSVAPCCVATKEAMCAQQTRLGTRDGPG